MKMALYQIVNRKLSFVQMIAVPTGTTDLDTWKRAAGYGANYTLRRGKVSDYTALDVARELGRPSAPVPSAATAIVEKMTRG